LIEIFAELASTSDKVMRRMAKGKPVPEGHWIIADRQTHGRGRHGRSWFDGAGNFMGSTFVERKHGDPAPSTLSLVAALAVHEVVSRHVGSEHQIQLKWPNDLLVDGAKIAGILLEGVQGGVVIGVGVNLTVAPKLLDRPTTAILRVGTAPDRDSFTVEMADTFDIEIARWREHGLAPIIRRWLANAHPIGTPLVVLEGQGQELRGTFAGLAADGALQLRLADGATRAIHAGEVSLDAATRQG
jgi:BirA family biotin operon repressor/biotin-[acetyl-CoA-carboxylase] ligase